jgi:hypothetical protein
MKFSAFLGLMGNSNMFILILRLADGIIDKRLPFGGKIYFKKSKIIANSLPVCVVDHPQGHAAV